MQVCQWCNKGHLILHTIKSQIIEVTVIMIKYIHTAVWAVTEFVLAKWSEGPLFQEKWSACGISPANIGPFGKQYTSSDLVG